MLKAKWSMDETYDVIDVIDADEYLGHNGNEVILFSGTLSDCEAYIRLKETNRLVN